MRTVTYGPGGYDPKEPNGNVVDEVEIEDVAPEPDQATQIEDLYTLVGDLYTQTGADAAVLLKSESVSETVRSAVLATEAARARADTSAPRTRYQWVGGADGDLFQVEEESPRRDDCCESGQGSGDDPYW